jgi:hypothetical protein
LSLVVARAGAVTPQQTVGPRGDNSITLSLPQSIEERH